MTVTGFFPEAKSGNVFGQRRKPFENVPRYAAATNLSEITSSNLTEIYFKAKPFARQRWRDPWQKGPQDAADARESVHAICVGVRTHTLNPGRSRPNASRTASRLSRCGTTPLDQSPK